MNFYDWAGGCSRGCGRDEALNMAITTCVHNDNAEFWDGFKRVRGDITV